MSYVFAFILLLNYQVDSSVILWSSFQIAMLGKFSEAIRGNLSKNQRLKIVSLVTIEVHARDIIEKLIKGKVADHSAFDWLSQLRIYWDKVSYTES